MSLPKPDHSRLAVGIAAATTAAIVVGLAWGFTRQLVLAHQMQAEDRRLEQAVAAEQARHDELVTQLEYARSDEYVENWARGEARLARPGEVAIVVLEDEEPAGGVQPTPAPEPEGRPFWAEVWEAVFGPAGR